MRLVILDRDGVINHDSDTHIKSPDEWRPISGSLEAIARLCRADYKIVIATNQSGIARGLFNIDTLNRIHSRMLDHIHKKGGAVDAIFICPHDSGDGCHCRKPEPGMLLDIAKRLKTTLHGVLFAGDSVTDLHAAINAGAQPVLLLSGKNELDLIPGQRITCDPALCDVPVFQNLAAFTDALLEGRLNTNTVAPERRS
ncbi:MAG: D-glycero-beta-D-manno-heptose 1,7-bisphosphate 7-phosphatase [Gammaproteobacteria bacterium]|nr:D-glycero-beta-D-manno-heptose 1,7-bisphosphate 7-phosphatase [Gammaproteobacteria bacterium]MDH3464433.1 D-glycero-beta-D-manno-heptose 1,7-bisphosphate 7-phosphatase [Gammaproteobacteria bacterium]